MQRIERSVSEEQYKMLQGMTPKQVNDYIEDIACHSGFHPAGYGFSNPGFFKSENDYKVVWYCYDSCD